MKRTIHHGDALKWLEDQGVLTGCSIITSMPDFSEFRSLSLLDWKDWFIGAASRVLLSCPDDGVSIFYQTDIKKEGIWIDKGFLCQKAAEMTGHELVSHKIVCRASPGTATFGRPSYSHMLCFSKNVRGDFKKATPDVLETAGKVTWTPGMGVDACRLACQIVIENTLTRTIVDPFCGHGTVLAVANELGLDAIGIERNLKRVKISESLSLIR